MKIGEKTDFLETATVQLTPSVEVIVNSLPFGWQENMARKLPSPVAPLKPAFNADGEPIYKNRKTKQQATEHNEDDPEYKRLSAAQTKRQAAYQIYHGTKYDPNLTWDTDPALEEKEPVQFYQGIYDELKAANIGSGHMDKLMIEIMEISGHTEEQIKRMRAVFLAAGA